MPKEKKSKKYTKIKEGECIKIKKKKYNTELKLKLIILCQCQKLVCKKNYQFCIDEYELKNSDQGKNFVDYIRDIQNNYKKNRYDQINVEILNNNILDELKLLKCLYLLGLNCLNSDIREKISIAYKKDNITFGQYKNYNSLNLNSDLNSNLFEDDILICLPEIFAVTSEF